MIQRQFIMLQTLRGPAPVDQVEPDHRVNAGQIVAVFRKIKRASQVPLGHRATAGQGFNITQFAKTRGRDAPIARCPRQLRALQQQHRALVVKAPDGMDQGGPQFQRGPRPQKLRL